MNSTRFDHASEIHPTDGFHLFKGGNSNPLPRLNFINFPGVLWGGGIHPLHGIASGELFILLEVNFQQILSHHGRTF